MSKNFDPIRARSSIEALQAIAGTHPEAAVNVTALLEEVAAAEEEIAQLVRGLREAVEPPTFMGEPVNAVLGRDGVVRVEAPDVGVTGMDAQKFSQKVPMDSSHPDGVE